MAYMPGTMQTLGEQLTHLLMENGAAVTKPSIDALLKFIAVRDQSITDEVIRHAEKLTGDLQTQTRTSQY